LTFFLVTSFMVLSKRNYNILSWKYSKLYLFSGRSITTTTPKWQLSSAFPFLIHLLRHRNPTAESTPPDNIAKLNTTGVLVRKPTKTCCHPGCAIYELLFESVKIKCALKKTMALDLTEMNHQKYLCLMLFCALT